MRAILELHVREFQVSLHEQEGQVGVPQQSEGSQLQQRTCRQRTQLSKHQRFLRQELCREIKDRDRERPLLVTNGTESRMDNLKLGSQGRGK